mmetsp:Transcript_25205/g.69342  ORF Transcript_25205/g.69342 Transcript_25205/m.69342 type:complete len:136 (-) Transcript_25205:606-1013(-)|eukprot:scaffold222287_cov40-Tisochrysis_lutea.AAC.3
MCLTPSMYLHARSRIHRVYVCSNLGQRRGDSVAIDGSSYRSAAHPWCTDLESAASRARITSSGYVKKVAVAPAAEPATRRLHTVPPSLAPAGWPAALRTASSYLRRAGVAGDVQGGMSQVQLARVEVATRVACSV